MHQPGVLPVFPVFCSVRRFGETFRLTGNRDRRQDKDHRAELPRPWPRKRPVYSSSPQAERTGAETRTVFRLVCSPCRKRKEPAQKRAPSFDLCACLAAGGKNRRKNVHRRLVYSPHRRQEEPAQKRAPSFDLCAPLAAGGKTGAETRTVFRLVCSPRRWRENRREGQSRRPSQQTRRTCGRKSNRETRNAGAPEKKEPALCGKKEIKRAPAVPAGALVCFICTWEFTWCSVLPLRGTSEQLHF